jgi:hypothetical protein
LFLQVRGCDIRVNMASAMDFDPSET